MLKHKIESFRKLFKTSSGEIFKPHLMLNEGGHVEGNRDKPVFKAKDDLLLRDSYPYSIIKRLNPLLASFRGSNMNLDKILGCRIYYNRYLENVGMPIVFDCSSDAVISSSSTREAIVREAASLLSDVLKIDISIMPRDHAYMGKRFDLYMYELKNNKLIIGELRLVEVSRYFLNISGVLTGESLNVISSDILKELNNGITLGETLSEVFLDRYEKRSFPYGQKPIKSFVIYAAEGIPYIDTNTWKLTIKGEVVREINVSYDDLINLSRDLGYMTFHCVTGWSVKDRRWTGIRLRDLLEKTGYNSDARWVLIRSAAGYSTTLPLEEALADDTFIILYIDGKPLSKENGYPARIFNPRLYGWKSAKWITEIIILDKYMDGFWEALAYHERGYVEAEERFKIRNPSIAELSRLP